MYHVLYGQLTLEDYRNMTASEKWLQIQDCEENFTL